MSVKKLFSQRIQTPIAALLKERQMPLVAKLWADIKNMQTVVALCQQRRVFVCRKIGSICEYPTLMNQLQIQTKSILEQLVTQTTR
jgi:hypothetical protein